MDLLISIQNPDDTMNIKNISKFGRSFSLLRIPYSFKLLIQELSVMNIQMRIITENNVDQLNNMCYSTNINKLLNTSDGLDQTIKEYINTVKNKLNSSTVYNKQDIVPYETPQLPSELDKESKTSTEGYIPKSPDYPPILSQYPPESPPYPPESPQYPPESPDYAPYSPAYVPESPLDNKVIKSQDDTSSVYNPSFSDSNSGQNINQKENETQKSILEVEEPKEDKEQDNDSSESNNDYTKENSQNEDKKVIINLDKNENIEETNNSNNSKKITL